ncbi:MAG: energy transducer TonB [Methylophilus sp.]|uniref:energy transducer TonB n=1 Tax=Methylophilus sp. TaxID=29541 RepID=UPI003F9EEBA1
MTSLVLMEDESHAKVWRAVGISIGLHLLVVAIYPHLNSIRLPDIPERMEIEFFSIKAPPPAPSVQQVTPQVETPPAPPVVVPKPQPTKPVQTPKPILAAPDSDAEHRVAEQPVRPEPVKTEPAPPVTATAPAAATASHDNTRQASSDEHAAKDARAATNTAAVSNDSDELTASDSDAWGDYGEQLRSLVNKSKQYPTIAIRRHLEGDVTIVAQFTKGELTQVSLAETSKHVPLDEEAIRMVKKAIQQLGLKESLKKKTFKITIPVSFRLE